MMSSCTKTKDHLIGRIEASEAEKKPKPAVAVLFRALKHLTPYYLFFFKICFNIYLF